MNTIRYATSKDLDYLQEHDTHVPFMTLPLKIEHHEVLVYEKDDIIIGWLRFGYFWDEIPFMNMLLFLAEHRGNGYGRELIEYWEKEMREKHHSKVMTSTQSDEQAQFFYKHMGYSECGSFHFPDQEKELMFMKEI